MQTIGERLKEIRTDKKQTMDEFAKSLSVTTRAYSNYERDERKSPDELYHNLHFVYDVNLNWLITGDGKKYMPPTFEDEEEKLVKKVEEILRKKGVC